MILCSVLSSFPLPFGGSYSARVYSNPIHVFFGGILYAFLHVNVALMVSSLLHRVFRQIWFGSKVEVFKPRCTLL